MKKQQIVIALVVLALVLVFAAFSLFSGDGTTDRQAQSAPPTEDALDAVGPFYDAWLGAKLSTTSDPVAAGLVDSTILSPSLRTKISTALDTATEDSLDPVLCQILTPERMGGRILFAQPTEAQVMMFARGLEERSPFQAVVSLIAVNEQWQISDIDCIQGDTAPVRDFDFEREGFLLKSVPPPLNPDFWHLVYEENGQMGRTVPLTVNTESICVQANGEEAVCDESTFRDATKVLLRADMSETGATVRRLEF